MTSVSNIAGGLTEVKGGKETYGGRLLVCGGTKKIVGENAEWYTNDKLYDLKYVADDKYCKNVNDKKLLKIVDLKLPISFNRKKFYDDGKKQPDSPGDAEIHKKVILELQNRLNEPITAIIKRLVDSYDLHHPLFWVMGELIRCLAFTHKKFKKNKRRIKITHDLTPLVEQIWSGKNYFRYDIDSPDSPSTFKELIKQIFAELNKLKIPQGKWKEPVLKKIDYPVITTEVKKRLQNSIQQEKDSLSDRLKDVKKPIDETKEYVLAVLRIEYLLLDHLKKIEEYYIIHSENISSIISSIKNYFSSIKKV